MRSRGGGDDRALRRAVPEALTRSGATAGLSGVEEEQGWGVPKGKGAELDGPTVTLSEARERIGVLAHRQSILLLSPPGVGKSDTVASAAEAEGLGCRSLHGTEIAPEDVSGVPPIAGEGSV